jgi:apolipoprotein N-acyltransferase
LDVKWDSETAKLQWETLERLSRRAGQENPDLIVWPESARPFPLYHWLDRPETYRMAEVQALARELGSAFLVGAEYYRVRGETDFDLYNAAMAVNARGEIDPTWVAKVYLVPFAEATPFRSLLGPLIEDRGGEWRWMAGAFEPGPRDTLLDIDGARVGVLVCFEQLFPDLARGLRNAGADLQVVITNDAWFGRTPFQHYQANAVRLRAIENRSAFVRAANTGISGFVDRKGRYHQATSLFEEEVVVADVRVGARPTVYGRSGDLVVGFVLAALACTLALAFRQ